MLICKHLTLFNRMFYSGSKSHFQPNFANAVRRSACNCILLNLSKLSDLCEVIGPSQELVYRALRYFK